MAYIGKQPVVGNFVKLDSITTSATTTFNLTNGGVAYSPQSPNHCIVSLNGVIQSPNTSFTISGSTIVFISALTAIDVIDFILVLGDVLNIGTPSDNTVSTAKLATDLTVTHALGSAGSPSITFTGDTNTGIFSPTADTIAFAEGGTEVMRINSGGDVLIGVTTTPSGTIGGSGFIDDTVGRWILYLATTANATTQSLALFINANGTVGSITVNGSATAYNTSSDYRLKENINYDFDATTRLKQLKPARFNFKADANKTVDGFIAHEVQSVIPEAITGIKDEIDSEGNPVYQGIDQSKLTPILTKALQEAIAKIEQLEARLTALENN